MLCKKNEIFTLVKGGLENNNTFIKVGALEVMVTFIEFCEPKDSKAFEDLI